MKNFVAYHKVAEWGLYEPDGSTEFRHYSGHAQSKLEKAIGQNVWVVSGTKTRERTIYKLCGVYQPTHIEELSEGGFIVAGNGIEIDPQIELNGFSWLADLLKEQRNFSYGLNEVRNNYIIDGLQNLYSKIQAGFRLPDEIRLAKKLPEGARKQITVNAYERNPLARAACIEHYGYKCSVCNFDFEAQYGDLGKEYIHVHHLRSLSSIAEEYEVDPIEDLRPVCPNCHAMIHRKEPNLSLDQIRSKIRSKF